MRLILTTAIATLAIATAACNNKADDTTVADANLATDMAINDADMMIDNGATSTAMPAMPASEFANAVAASDRYEIDSGKIAADKASSAELKAFGTMLVADHGKASADFKSVAAKATPAITPADALSPEQTAMIDALKAAKGADFDAVFIDQQTKAHQKTLDALTAYSAGGDSEPLRAFATKAVPVVQAHLDKLAAMKK